MDFHFTYRRHTARGACLIELDGVAHIISSDWEDGGWMIDDLSAFGCKDGKYELERLPRSDPEYFPIKRWLSYGDQWVDIDKAWQLHQHNQVKEAV